MRLPRHWFLFGLAIVLIGAAAAPAPWAKAMGSAAGRRIDTLCIVGIFLLNGLTLPTRQMKDGLASWRLHLFTQGLCFVAAPLLFLALDQLLGWLGFPPGLRGGLLVLGCLPTTVTSCVVLTRVAGGNESGALCNAVLGNLLGIVLTPLLVLLLLGHRGQVDALRTIQQLGLVVVLPVLIGQMLQLALRGWVERQRSWLNPLSPLLLLVLMFLIFTRSFAQTLGVSLSQVLALLAIALVMHGLLLLLAWHGGKLPALRLTRPDRIAAALCGSEKTIAVGIPMIAVLFAATGQAALIGLPLVIYHPLQLLVDGLLAPVMKKDGK